MCRLLEVCHAKCVHCYYGNITAGSARKIAMVTAGEIFNLYTHSTKQIQQYKLFALSSVISILSCDQFTNKVSNN